MSLAGGAPGPAWLAPSRRLGAGAPRVVGVVNVTPDSFSDGGRFLRTEAAVAHGLALAAEGADWLDMGGESTRPGAVAPPLHEEEARVVPVLRALAAALPGLPLSIDTRRAEVARAALDAGATVVNDVSGGQDAALLELVARRGCGLVLGHLRGTPATMQAHTAYDDVVGEVERELLELAARAVAAGVPAAHLVLDPGLGFGKAPADNPRLFALVPRLRAAGFAVMIGASRKRFIGELTGRSEPAERVFGSVGAAVAAMVRGADLVRVHDVQATIETLLVARACLDGQLADVAG